MKVKTYFCVNWFSTYCTDCDECKCSNPRFMNLLEWLVEKKKIQKIASHTPRTRNKSDLGRNKFTNICFSYSSWKPAGSNTSPLKSQLVFGSCASVKVLDTVTFKRKDHQVGLLIVRISAIVIQVANSSEISLEVSMTAANKSCVSWTGREILRKEMNW